MQEMLCQGFSIIHMHSVFKPCKSKKQRNAGTDILDDKVVVNVIYEGSKEAEKDEKTSLRKEMEGNQYTPV